MDYGSFLELLKKRRSIKRLKPDPIPDDYIDKIIEAARWAPSGANSQPWEFLVVKKKELKEQIMAVVGSYREANMKLEETRPQEMRHAQRPGANVAEAPVFILLLGDERTEDAYPLAAKANHGWWTLISSLSGALLCMHLAAASLGLGSRWVSAVNRPYLQPIIKKLLGIPQDMEVHDMMVLGYPAGQPSPRIVRPREEMVHRDGYDISKHRTDEQIKQFVISLRRGE
ncbi:MAG: nitroreductase family protein [Dehalococcoidia bacterium]|nr:nitroreductase family protein [Dehalococcoidia bacterium]